mmetsp:Transcript_60849/g.162763  ORF Transcript_60849/g.162763 Transcript_60849/m.162763 type:complete len:263 (-) Transcript_60849:10-798(-)
MIPAGRTRGLSYDSEAGDAEFCIGGAEAADAGLFSCTPQGAPAGAGGLQVHVPAAELGDGVVRAQLLLPLRQRGRHPAARRRLAAQLPALQRGAGVGAVHPQPRHYPLLPLGAPPCPASSSSAAMSCCLEERRMVTARSVRGDEERRHPLCPLGAAPWTFWEPASRTCWRCGLAGSVGRGPCGGGVRGRRRRGGPPWNPGEPRSLKRPGGGGWRRRQWGVGRGVAFRPLTPPLHSGCSGALCRVRGWSFIVPRAAARVKLRE